LEPYASIAKSHTGQILALVPRHIEREQHRGILLREGSCVMRASSEPRVNYELMASHWPHADEDPSATMQERRSSRASGVTCPSSSTRARDSTRTGTPRSCVSSVDIQRLKQQPGGDMVVGGANLAATFARYQLVDEYRIHLQPVVLGAGYSLFPPSETRLPLRLNETRRFGNGVVLLNYATG
jgi:dihydrofolate reductase